MKKVDDFGYPKRNGFYWCWFPDNYKCKENGKPILCRVEKDRVGYDVYFYDMEEEKVFDYDSNQYVHTEVRDKLHSWKSIPIPKIK